jgi:GAF domain-containing protein
MMHYLRSLFPLTIPDQLDKNDQLKVWQERILQSLFLAAAGFGLVFVLLFLSTAINTGNWSNVSGFLGLFIICATFFLLRRIGYWVRSIIALIIVFIFSNFIYFQNGWTGISLILLLVFSFLCTTLLYQRPTRIGFFISITTLLFWATLRLTNIIKGTGLSSSLNSLAIDLLILLLAGFTVNFVISSLKNKYLSIYRQNLAIQSEKDNLELEFRNQNQILERRVNQLRTAAEINRTISAILDPASLIRQVADSVKERFDLYYVGVFLVDEQKEFAVLQYGTGEAGRKMVANRHRLAVGGYSMIGWTTQTRKPRIALDTGAEAVRFDNPLLPDTKSELALPLASQKNLYGAMTIQSDKPNAFDENDILVLQTIADSLAIALENDNSFQVTQKALEDIRVLNKAYVQQAWGETIANYGDLKYSFENPEVPASQSEIKTINVPLLLRDEVIGEINLEVTSDELSQSQLEFLKAVSDQTSSALENARLLEETQRAAAKEQKLNDLSSQFSRALTIEEILKSAVIEFGKLPLVSEASISLIPPEEMNIKPTLDKSVRQK